MWLLICTNYSDDENARLSDVGTDSMGGDIPKKRSYWLKSEKKFACSLCGRTYNSKSGLAKHIIEHGNVTFNFKPFSVNVFLEILSTSLGPDGRLIHKCDCCPIYFESTALRDAHHMTEHKERMTCKICNKIFRRYDTLGEHVRIQHKRSGPKIKFVCVKCGEYRQRDGIIQKTD